MPARVVIVRAQRNRGIYIILGLFLGLFGVHNFYAGRHGPGAVQLLITVLLFWTVVTLAVTALWVLIELAGVETDGEGQRMS